MLMLLHCPFSVERNLPRRWSWSLRVLVFAAAVGCACLCIRWPGAWALDQVHTGARGGEREPFRVANFFAAPVVFNPSSRALPYHMPVALSSRFDIRVEVLASVKDLEEIHIAGHRLTTGSTSKPMADPLCNPALYAKTWHRVRLSRDGPDLALWIDGRRSSANLNPAATSEWLTFEPGPAHPTSFRNLIVDW
jgi:hypothetical protein